MISRMPLAYWTTVWSKKCPHKTLVLLLLQAVVTPLSAEPNLSLYTTITSDYVFRGVSQSDEHVSFQLGLDVEFENGLFLGAWAATIDVMTSGRLREREIDYYLGYIREIGSKWSIGATVSRYTYPGDDGAVDYDYNEIALLANFDDHAWLEAAYIKNIFGHDGNARNLEFTTQWPIGTGFNIGLVGGYSDLLNDNSDYVYWQIGLGRRLGRLGLDLRYHDTSSTPNFIARPGLAGSRIAFSINAAF